MAGATDTSCAITHTPCRPLYNAAIEGGETDWGAWQLGSEVPTALRAISASASDASAKRFWSNVFSLLLPSVVAHCCCCAECCCCRECCCCCLCSFAAAAAAVDGIIMCPTKRKRKESVRCALFHLPQLFNAHTGGTRPLYTHSALTLHSLYTHSTLTLLSSAPPCTP